MLNNSALVNMIYTYISSGHMPNKTDCLYPAFMEWKKVWKGRS